MAFVIRSTHRHKQGTSDRDRYDVAIMGAGPGGYATALRAAELGGRVLLVDSGAVVGGTCLNRGCIPTKALITAAHAIEGIRNGAAMGIHAKFTGVDDDRLNAYKNGIVKAMTDGLASLLNRRGVTVLRGTAELVQPHQFLVTPCEGDDNRPAEKRDARLSFTAKDIVIATGGTARSLPTADFSDVVVDSDRALAMRHSPKRAVIIGSGAVALEFARIWHAVGCEVTLLARRDRVLSHWSRRSGVVLTRELKRQGIDVVTGAQCTGIDVTPDRGTTDHAGAGRVAKVSYRLRGEERTRSREAQTVLVAVGRRPNTSAPWFNRVGIARDTGGHVVTDPLGCTSVDHVWAAGDVTAGPQQAHRAFEQGIVIAEAIAGLNPAPVDNATIPQVVYTSPEVASVGLGLQEARSRDDLRDVRETAFPMGANSRVRMSGLQGALSVVTGVAGSNGDRAPRLVLGVHMVGPGVSENIAEAEQLVGGHVSLHEAARLIHPHPTVSEALGEALLKADGRPLHTW